MRKPVKQAFLYLSRAFGLFRLARRVTRRGLRILCFHGGSVGDEHCFRPGLFMRPETMRRRLESLTRQGYPVLDLASALQALEEDRLPPCAAVLTIDDGFYSTFSQAGELLRQYGLPATVYVTTYYMAKKSPIFRLVVSYLFWKTKKTSLDGDRLLPEPSARDDLTDVGQKERLRENIIEYGETHLNEHERGELARELAKHLGIDYEALVASRALHIMEDHEVRALADGGIDIQLHTHRHRFPTDLDLAAQELIENRALLAGLVKQPLVHLCYPSGIWSEDHWPCLTAQDIASAVTCDPGFNYTDTPRFALRRFLDADDISDIEFEAELSGFSELLRGMRAAATAEESQRSPGRNALTCCR